MRKSELPIVFFASSREMETWMKKNHANSDGVRIQFLKKHVKRPCVSHDDAIDLALCFGWIDSQSSAGDKDTWFHRFTPRKAKSIWSKRNIKHVERLTKARRMRPAGLAQFNLAKKDGRLTKAYDPPSTMNISEDFLKELKKSAKAEKFFLTLNKANRYAIGWRLQTAKKPETRAKRMKLILEMMKKGQKFH